MIFSLCSERLFPVSSPQRIVHCLCERLGTPPPSLSLSLFLSLSVSLSLSLYFSNISSPQLIKERDRKSTNQMSDSLERFAPVNSSGAVHLIGNFPGRLATLHSNEPAILAKPMSEIFSVPSSARRMWEKGGQGDIYKISLNKQRSCQQQQKNRMFVAGWEKHWKETKNGMSLIFLSCNFGVVSNQFEKHLKSGSFHQTLHFLW